jgi:hypothetical protein
LQFEALSYSQKLLEQWYSINSTKGIRPNTVKRWQLFKVYTTTKQQLSFTLWDSKNENYGVRQEYYIIIKLLRALKEGDINAIKLPTLSAASSVVDDQGIVNGVAGYRLYWVLAINEVNTFVAIEMN